MAYFTPGSLIHYSTCAAVWRVTAVNPDGSIEVVFVSGRRRPAKREKRIERTEEYQRVDGLEIMRSKRGLT